jgi:hypothetical protein
MRQLNLVSGLLLWCVHLDEIGSIWEFGFDKKKVGVRIEIEFYCVQETLHVS